MEEIDIKFFPADEKTFLRKSFETSGTTEFMNAFNEHLEETKFKIHGSKADTEIFKNQGCIHSFIFKRK